VQKVKGRKDYLPARRLTSMLETACRKLAYASGCKKAGLQIPHQSDDDLAYTDDATEVFERDDDGFSTYRVAWKAVPALNAATNTKFSRYYVPPYSCVQIAGRGSEVMQVAPSSSTCRSDRDARTASVQHCAALKQYKVP
jgi:hypothetical protein